MSEQMTFKRYEIKYRLTKEQKKRILEAMEPYMKEDTHGRSQVQSLYFDTPDDLLVRRSLDHPYYKEKLRLRSYGVTNAESKVYLEIKKKSDSIVYKRREEMTQKEANDYIENGRCPKDTQIFREIAYTLERYPGLEPKVLLSYERDAFYGKDDHEFRVTFDENVLWRDYDVDLSAGIYGTPVIGEDEVLMEVKIASAMPLWFAKVLSQEKIYKTSFSKYGTAYGMKRAAGR